MCCPLLIKKLREKRKSDIVRPNYHSYSKEFINNWKDYPCINVKTERKLKYGLGHYFDSWENYCKNGDDTNYNTKED